MKKILIVNRGEIAIRIARACKELGFESVGLYTDSELEAPHLAYCDRWIHLKGANNSETYLNQDQLLQIMDQYDIDGVHPGYGFLAENESFCKRVVNAGKVWIGPHSEAIRLMGDKAVSKTLAAQTGVPTVPGSKGEVATIKEALEIANKIGYPILLKAVAGGGGKGMRVCESDEQLLTAFDSVKREAKSSFDNDGVLVEKFIVDPHHIEVQILADKNGNIFHLYERECSIQRRHQKIIEEAPSPFIGDDEDLREKICQTAVQLARAVQYDSAGTVEFIMGADKQFYFLEMNTRIQVEHPITEEITGIDLVAEMIRSAFHLKMHITLQSQIQKLGHAIECRICAEDPVTMLPAPGKVVAIDYQFSAGVRFDHCLYAGFEVKPDFDPMIGKLICRGFNRSHCMEKMRRSLLDLKIYGLKNNIELHKIILNEESFIKGIYTTNYINEIKPQDLIVSDLPIDVATHWVLGYEGVSP